MKGHLNDILKFEASPYEVSWNLMKGKLDIGEWSWIINTCWWVWLSFKFQNFTAPFSEKVNAHLPLINTDKILWNQFEREKLSSYFTMFRKKKGILVTIFTNHNAVWNSKSRVAVQFNLLSYNSLLYPYIIFFLYAAQMFLLAIYTSHLGINLTVGKNLRNRLHWIAVLVWRPFT